jgi:hypothetical protein
MCLSEKQPVARILALVDNHSSALPSQTTLPMNRSTLSPVFVSFLCLLGSWIVSIQATAQAEPVGSKTAESTSIAADSLLLDQYPDAHAAYSLRKLRSDYTGPAIRVRRSSDDAEQDIGFDDSGMLDTSALESFVGNGDGHVTTWYSQAEGANDLTEGTNSNQPLVAQGGTVVTNSDGKPTILFTDQGSLSVTFGFYFLGDDHLLSIVGDMVDPPSGRAYDLFEFNGETGVAYTVERADTDATNVIRAFNAPVDGSIWAGWGQPGFWGMNFEGSTHKTFNNNAVADEEAINDSGGLGKVTIKNGMYSEWAVLPGQPTEDDVLDVYDNVNADWNLGPEGYHRDALLPQDNQWMIDLYDWLETLDESDVTLSDGTVQYDNSYDTEDELADLWMKIEGLTASSVTRRPPEWYVLDNGNGKGIEATGVVRPNHHPRGGQAGGNPPRSWQNEPAVWYDSDIPLTGGGAGQPVVSRASDGAACDGRIHSGYAHARQQHGRQRNRMVRYDR